MGRLALVVVVVAGLAAPAGLAAHTPRWSAKGAITKLTKRSITVNGKSCQITTDSPRLGLHVFVVGSTVKIICADGSLLTIDLVRPGSVTSASSPGTSGQSVSVSSSSASSTSGSSSAGTSALALAGDFSITALGSGSITVQGGKSSYSCKVGTGSPDVGAFRVGGHVSKMTCKDDVLTMIAP
jgi:hypothetical protein